MITFKEYFDKGDKRPIAPAVFIGWMDNPAGAPIPLFNLTEEIQAPEADVIKAKQTYDQYVKTATEKGWPVIPFRGANLKPGFTVSVEKLTSLGFYVPTIPPGTPKNTSLASLDDRQMTTEAQTRENPFGYNRRKPLKQNQGQQRMPAKTYKHELKAKPNKKDFLKPRRWQVNSVGKLIRLFGK